MPRRSASRQVSAGICWPSTSARKPADAAQPGDLLGAGGDVEQRADRVEVAVGPARRLAAAGRRRAAASSGQPVPDHRLHSASSAVPPDRTTPSQVRSSAASRRGGARRPARARRPRAGRGRAARRRAARARAGAWRRPPSSARSAARSARPSSRVAIESSPPSGEVSSSCASSGPGATAAGGDPQGEQQRAYGGVGGQRDLVPGHLDRHAGRDQGAGQRGDALPAGPDEHRHLASRRRPSRRCARAQQVGDVLGLGARAAAGDDLDPAAGRGAVRLRVAERLEDVARQRRRHGQPAGDVPAGGQQGRPEAPGGAEREHRRRLARRRPEAAREVEDAAGLGAAERVDRLVGVADRDHVATVAGQRLQQADLGGVGVLVLVDEDRADLARAAWRRPRGRRAGCGCGARARRSRARPRRRGRRGTPRRTPPPAPSPRARRPRRPATTSTGSMPSWRALARTARTWPANARVPKAFGQRLRPRVVPDLLAALQHLADPEVLLRPGQQPDAGPVRRARARPRLRHRAGQPEPVGEPAHQGVAERVERHRRRRDDGPPEPPGDPGPQVGRRPPREGQDEHRARARPRAGRSGRRPTRPASSSCPCPGRRAPAADRRGAPTTARLGVVEDGRVAEGFGGERESVHRRLFEHAAPTVPTAGREPGRRRRLRRRGPPPRVEVRRVLGTGYDRRRRAYDQGRRAAPPDGPGTDVRERLRREGSRGRRVVAPRRSPRARNVRRRAPRRTRAGAAAGRRRRRLAARARATAAR